MSQFDQCASGRQGYHASLFYAQNKPATYKNIPAKYHCTHWSLNIAHGGNVLPNTVSQQKNVKSLLHTKQITLT